MGGDRADAGWGNIMMPIHPGLLVAGGLGLAGAGFLAFKHFGKDDKPKEAKPAGGGDAAQGAGQLGADPLAQQPTATDQAGMGASQAGALQGEQVGPYTIVDDGTGTQIVFETATQTPVGVLDAQGNMIPISVDANGNVTIDESAAGTAATPTAGTNAGVATSEPMGTQAQYSQVAEELFANVANGTAGAATSGSMAPTTATAAPTTAGTVAPTAGPAGQVTTRVVGEFTVVEDGSGTGLVLDTASQQPVGMIDAAGNITPISVDAAGNPTVAGATTPTAVGSVAPTTVTAPTTITSPVGVPAVG